MDLATDTSLLLLLLGAQCLRQENAPALRRVQVLTDIRGRSDAMSPERFDDLWNLFQSAARRIVTQHVIAETYGLSRLLASFRKELVWQSALGLLTDPGIEEQSCLVRDMNGSYGYGDILREIGPADAGLIYIAEHNKATIITDDGALARWASVRSVRAVLLNQIGFR